MEIQTKLAMSPAEYLEWEMTQELKHEYIDGEIIEMSGGSGKHSKIMVNISAAIYNQINLADCVIHSSEMRVRVSDTRYVYPDLSALCGKEDYEDESEVTLLNPTFVLEVTSPLSLMRDRLEKPDLYFNVPSIEEFLIVDQDRPRADLYRRSEDGWRLRVFSDPAEDVIPLPSLDCKLPLAAIYRRIALDEV